MLVVVVVIVCSVDDDVFVNLVGNWAHKSIRSNFECSISNYVLKPSFFVQSCKPPIILFDDSIFCRIAMDYHVLLIENEETI